MTYELLINGEKKVVDVPADTPLLWVIREELELKGTKFGCGMGLCGACTVHLDGQPARSCITPVAAVGKASLTTIEGLPAQAGAELHPLQEAWIRNSVPQCGYCQSGQLMAAAGLLNENANPSPDEIRQHMSGNICRCGTYSEIERSIRETIAAKAQPEEGK